MSRSSSSSSSASPEPELSKQLLKSAKKKGKEKSGGRNEGADPNWEYKPPDGATLLQNTEDAGEFDWDAIANNNDLELWLIRVPESIKPRYLENTKVEIPPTTAQNIRVGSLDRKYAAFDIWSIGEGDQDDVGGEEVKALSCLLPRKTKNGQLFPAPKPIARHIVVSARAVVPSEDPSLTSPVAPYSRPPREKYPKEALKHRFMPYGSLSNASIPDKQLMDVDIPARQLDSISSSKSKHSKSDPLEPKKVKEKKRKGEGETSPKKSKRPKIS